MSRRVPNNLCLDIVHSALQDYFVENVRGATENQQCYLFSRKSDKALAMLKAAWQRNKPGEPAINRTRAKEKICTTRHHIRTVNDSNASL